MWWLCACSYHLFDFDSVTNPPAHVQAAPRPFYGRTETHSAFKEQPAYALERAATERADFDRQDLARVDYSRRRSKPQVNYTTLAKEEYPVYSHSHFPTYVSLPPAFACVLCSDVSPLLHAFWPKTIGFCPCSALAMTELVRGELADLTWVCLRLRRYCRQVKTLDKKTGEWRGYFNSGTFDTETE